LFTCPGYTHSLTDDYIVYVIIILKPGAYRRVVRSLNHRPTGIVKRMSTNMKAYELEASVEELRGWVEALSRRVEELEQSAFQLADQEEVVLVTVPRRRNHAI